MEILKLIVIVILLVEQNSGQINYEHVLKYMNSKTKNQLSSKCLEDINNTTLLSPWFWLMVDSSSKIPSGIAKGNLEPMGNYDECLDIAQIETQFCKISINFDLDTTKLAPPSRKINFKAVGIPEISSAIGGISFYVCVFKSCKAKDLNLVVNDLLQFEDEQCLSKDSQPKLDALAIFAIIVFTIFGLITLGSTIYDVYISYINIKPVHKILLAFSLYTNGKKLLHLESGSGQFLCLNGLKSLSMMWVVLGHEYMSSAFVPIDNYLDVYEWLNTPRSQFIAGATVSVDTFLVIAGFLTIYTFHASMNKGVKFNILLYYLHRYLRLTPALAAIVLSHVALFNYFGSGPVWQNTEIQLVKACREYWWSTLLYIQNYVNPNATCVPQSWYLSVDMQLFVISPILLVLMRQWPILGYIILTIASFLSMIGAFLISWFLKLNGQMTANVSGNLVDFMTYYYMPTHTRMVPYLLGIMLGHTIYNLKKSQTKLRMHTIITLLGWIAAIGTLLACIFGGNTLQFTEYNRLANAFYISLMRPAWGVAICWIIFACVMDHGGPINNFLSLPIFQILSRLCYSIYLVHYSYLFLTKFIIRQPLHYTDYAFVHQFLGNFVICVAISVLWALIFESPVTILEKMLLKRVDSSTRGQKPPIV